MTAREKTEYSKIETEVHDFYVDFRDRKGREITRNYLMLTQKLLPLRVACSGGQYPLPSSVDEKVVEDESVGTKAKRKQVEYSTFEFTSKLKVLIKQLDNIRNSDPSSESFLAKWT